MALSARFNHSYIKLTEQKKTYNAHKIHCSKGDCITINVTVRCDWYGLARDFLSFLFNTVHFFAWQLAACAANCSIIEQLETHK